MRHRTIESGTDVRTVETRNSDRTDRSGADSDGASGAGQLHLRLLPHEAAALRRLANARCQTISGAVSYLLRKELRSQGHNLRADDADDK